MDQTIKNLDVCEMSGPGSVCDAHSKILKTDVSEIERIGKKSCSKGSWSEEAYINIRKILKLKGELGGRYILKNLKLKFIVLIDINFNNKEL